MLLAAACRWEPYHGLSQCRILCFSPRLQQLVRQGSMCHCLVRQAGMQAQVQQVWLSGMAKLIG